MSDTFQTEGASSEPQTHSVPGDDSPTLPLAGASSGSEPPTTAGRSPRRRDHRRLWIALALVALLALAVAGVGAAAYVHAQLQLPKRAVTAFCANLTAGSYAAAYSQFSAGMRRQLSATQFPQIAQTLDTIEGRMTDCRISGGYHYSLGSSAASAQIVLTRAKQGSLSGPMRLVHERDGWKVDSLDNSLLGVNLGALSVAENYCSALQAQDFAAAYKDLSAKLQGATSQSAYVAQAQAHAQVDGAVQSCALTGLTRTTSATTTNFTISLARAKLGARSGALTLTSSNGAWQVSSVDAALSGSDLGPLDAGAAFCAAITNNDYAGAYARLSGAAHNTYSLAQFQQQFAVTPILKWNGCTPDLTTYKVAGDHASYNTALKVTRTDTGASTQLVFALSFVREGSAWKVDSWMLVTVK